MKHTHDMQDCAAEATEMETDMQAIFNSIPQEQAQALKQAAASISGKSAESFTVEQAMQVLQGRNPDPTIDAELDRVAEDAMAQIPIELLLNLKLGDELQAAKESGMLEDLFIRVISSICAIGETIVEMPNKISNLQIGDTGNKMQGISGIVQFFTEIFMKGFLDALTSNQDFTEMKGFLDALALNQDYDQTQTLKNLPHVSTNPVQKLNYPVDKINANIWDDLTEIPRDSSGKMLFAMEKSGRKTEATTVCSIDFDGLEELEQQGILTITRHLTPFDKRVYIAVNALFEQNGPYMSAGQIYETMGNTGKPSREQLEKINDSLTKMRHTSIYLDNSREITVNKGYARFVYDDALLPFKRESAYIHNALADSAICLRGEPPLIAFARARQQVTTISKKLLQSPMSKTDANLRLDDYLMVRISRMKTGNRKTSRKMLYGKIYERCLINTTKQRSRAPEKIRKYLEHYKKNGFIKGYTEEADGITIIL